MMLRQTSRRRALTLLEVVLAMAIFLISIVAIWQLFILGMERASDVKSEARTSLRCQGLLNELIIGSLPLTTSGGYTNFEDEDKDLQWKVEVNDGPSIGLYEVKVWVKLDPPVGGHLVESHLCQMVLDPGMRGSSLDRPTPPAQPATPTP
jgi:hypothetical protein